MRLCEGRLSLESGVAVATNPQTSKTKVFLEPYDGNRVEVFVSGVWQTYTFTQLQVNVPNIANGVFDIFVQNTGGNLSLTTVNWTSDSTRATNLVSQDGVLVADGNTGLRYLGTCRTTSTSGVTEFSPHSPSGTTSKLLLWNRYNQIPVAAVKVESTASWDYTTATWRAANNDTNNRIEFVIGVSGQAVDSVVKGLTYNASLINTPVGIGLDSTSVNSAQIFGCATGQDAFGSPTAYYEGYPQAGYHYFQWLELSQSGVTPTTWYGSDSLLFKSGIEMNISC